MNTILGLLFLVLALNLILIAFFIEASEHDYNKEEDEWH